MILIFIIYNKEKEVAELPNGVFPLDVFISSTARSYKGAIIEGNHGNVPYGSSYDTKNVKLYFRAEANDAEDYRLLRDEIYSFFTKEESFYVAEEYQPNKIHHLKIEGTLMPERYNKRVSTFEVDCTPYRLPFSESIATTQELHDQLLYSDEKWSYGMGLLHDVESHIYTHNALEFSIYNAGNVAIHPFEQDLLITIANAAKNYELKNLTTGDTFKYTGDTQGTLKLDGPNITLNNLQTLRDTNKEFITLVPGWNHFKQNQNREVSFDFRFYYL